MLGVSIVSFTVPACLGYAIHTYRSGIARSSSITALCLAVILAAPIALGLIVGTVMTIAQAFS